MNAGAASLVLNVPDLFPLSAARVVAAQGNSRQVGSIHCGQVVHDRSEDAECLFLRTRAGFAELELRLTGHHVVTACCAGGWLVMPLDETAPVYWVPTHPTSRKMDAQGHILDEALAEVIGIVVSAACCR